jgi:hypothetical protein
MYMLQNIEKSRHKQLERKAREDRRRALTLQSGSSENAVAARKAQQAMHLETTEEAPAAKDSKTVKAEEKSSKKKTKKDDKEVLDLEKDDDDLF